VIARQARHLTRLVDDLLDVGRVMTGKIALDRQPMDLGEAARRAVSGAQSSGALEARVLTVVAETAWVSADAIRVDQILSNLLGNAVKYTPPDGTIAVAVRREDGEAVLEVQDSGIGMSAALVPRVFELFVQGDRGLDRAQGGLGIGLTLVERLAHLHGGVAEAFSEGPDRGSRFRVRFPTVAAPTAATGPESGRGAGLADVRRRRILIVEDNDDAREVLRRLLEHAGHEVHEAVDGPSGVETAERVRPDVALIDLGLPRLDGYEVARRLRARLGSDRLLLAALTGYGLVNTHARALAAGFDEHLVKPVTAEQLAEVLRRSLERDGRTAVTE
jgi:CheY-like chemotaxis protein/anti-sigma regulatory factor (Ser/Thr protein kinase)